MEQSGAEFYGGQEWEVRQAELAERYEAPLVTVDSAGEAITGCARCPDFCRVIMVNPVSRRGCQAHCAALAAEALRLGGVAAALCPCGLYTGALPLAGDTALVFGSFREAGQEDGLHRYASGVPGFCPKDEAAQNELISDLTRLYLRLPEGSRDSVVRLGKSLSALDLLAAVPGREARSSRISPALEYIRRHPERPVTVSEMARLCGMNSTLFSRLFTRETGERFRDYILRRKVELARPMLSDTGLSLGEIAFRLGFPCERAFIKAFKKFGKTALWAYNRGIIQC